ncbi:MAG: hypothetical protein IJK18_04680 [Clostridia bacterium]|nr:hypothetical protein [Clostridia bacterium]
METKKDQKKQIRGITLIALVITIIVLLILAGVSIAMLSGDNSILHNATNARDNSQSSDYAEKVKIAHIAALTNGQGNYTKENLETELSKLFSSSDNITVDEDTLNNEYVVKSKGTEIQRVKIPKSENVVDTSSGLWYNSRKIANSGDIRSILTFNNSSYPAIAEWDIGGNIKITVPCGIETDTNTGDSRTFVETPTRKNTSTMETISELNGTLDGQAIELGQYLVDFLENLETTELNNLIQGL